MDFASYTFLYIFFPIYIFVIIFLKKYNLNIKYSLILLSLLFYSFFSIGFLFLLILLILINFIFLKYKKIKYYLHVVIFINLLPLIFYKYANFLLLQINFIFGFDFFISNLILPLGISFYTFQIISFQLDNHKRDINWKFSNFLLFIIFFPQLISGPIIRSNEYEDNLKNNLKNNNFTNDFKIATCLVIIGLFKKVVLANNLLDSSENILNIADNNLITQSLSSLSFLLYVYFDFSGYSDIATGLARYTGYKLPINFNSPLKSKSLIIFWKNWHISLTRFLTDYLFNKIFYKLLTFKSSDYWMYINLSISVLVTFAIVGMWHGAYLSTVIFGILNGLGIIINHIFKKIFENTKMNLGKNVFFKYLFNILTILFVSFTMIFFRFNDFNQILEFLRSMMIINLNIVEVLKIINNNLVLVFSLIIATTFPNINQLFYKDKIYTNYHHYDRETKLINYNFVTNILMPILIIFIFLNLPKQETFIYFMF